MGHGYKHGTSGAKKENPLNFEVKTYPSETELTADKPSENTIGVITTTTMTKWVFSATEPAEPEVGMVWISVDKASAVEFNALKANTLQVYPVSAKQYENGAFAEKTAKIYQNDAWVEWINELYLYDNGTFADAEGGLQQVGVPYAGGGAGACEIQTNVSSVTIKTNGGASALVYFPTKCDLTHFKTLYFDGSFVKSSESDSGSFGFGVWKTIPTTDASAEASAILEGFRSQGTHALDVSDVTGEHYVGIVAYGFGSKYACTATMNQMYLK